MPKPSRETKFSGADGDREIFIFPVQLTTSRIGNLTRLVRTRLLYVMTIPIYIYTYIASLQQTFFRRPENQSQGAWWAILFLRPTQGSVETSQIIPPKTLEKSLCKPLLTFKNFGTGRSIFFSPLSTSKDSECPTMENTPLEITFELLV